MLFVFSEYVIADGKARWRPTHTFLFFSLFDGVKVEKNIIFVRTREFLEREKNVGDVAGNNGESGLMGIIDCHFAYASLIWYITIKADGIILSPLHSYQILSIASFSIHNK